MNIFVSAGEVSGDQALSAVLAALQSRIGSRMAGGSGFRLAGLGGDAARAQGLHPLAPMARTAVSGIGDVLLSALSLARVRRAALRALDAEGAEKPDLALLVDYPGLNLELARRARTRGIPVYFVAPPQAWVYRNPAAKAARAIRSLAGSVVHVLFPFEMETFSGAASKVVCGHFLAEALRAGEERDAAAAGGPAVEVRPPGGRRLLALCPGSRLHALRRNLPAWLAALIGSGVIRRDGPAAGGPEGLLILVPPHLEGEARSLADAALGAGAPAARTAGAPATGDGRGFIAEIVTDKGRILRESSWALAFPGTVTLELALAGIPAAVVAALDPLTLAVGRRWVKGPWLGLPNLLLGREAFPEWVGTAPALAPGIVSALWERLRDLSPGEAGAAAGGLRGLMGPASGPEVAAGECLKILEKG